MVGNKDSDFRTVRGYQLADRQKGRLTPALEDYLEMACRLCRQEGYTRVGEISRLLNVRPSSASKMITKLAGLGYLKCDRYEIIQLTENGREIGEYLLKRHDIVEEFLKLIGSSKPLMETELIEHALSPSTVSCLEILLDFFQSETATLKKYHDYKKQKMP